MKTYAILSLRVEPLVGSKSIRGRVVIEDSNNVEKEASTRWGREGWWWENEQRVGCSGLV